MAKQAKAEEAATGQGGGEFPQPKDEPATEPPQPSPADAQEQGFRDSITQLRNRSDLTAKAIAGVGSAAIGGIGIAKYADVFPFEACWLWGVALALGFAAMVVGVGLLSHGFLRVQIPIVMRSDLGLIGGLSPGEKQEIQAAFDDEAAFNDVDSLLAYEARSYRLRRVAKFLPELRRAELLAEADSISADVRATHARAAHAAVRRRASSAILSRPAFLALTLIAVGFAAATVSIDAIESARSELTTELANDKACADAAKAGVAIDALPEDCPDLDPALIKPVPAPPPPPEAVG